MITLPQLMWPDVIVSWPLIKNTYYKILKANSILFDQLICAVLLVMDLRNDWGDFFEMRSRYLERSLFRAIWQRNREIRTPGPSFLYRLPKLNERGPGLLGITRGCSSELIYKVDSACRLHRPERPFPEDMSRSPIEILHNGNTR